MPFARPSLTELRSQLAADISSRLKTADGLLRFSNLGVLGTSVAGLSHLHYAYLDWIAKQCTPFTATDEYLEEWAALKNVYRKAATQAVQTVVFSATSGKDIPAGTEVVRSDSVYYTTVSDATATSAGTVTVNVTATVAGADGNSEVGTVMTLGSAIDGVQSTGAVTAIVTKAIDQELDAALRTRMLVAYQSTARGGSQSDYEEWALQVDGVTRSWVNPIGFGAGTVVVYIMLDVVNSATNGFPVGSDGISASDNRASASNTATGDQLTAADYIFVLRPVTAMLYVCSPIAQAIDFTITGVTWTTTLKTAIDDAISQVLLDEGTPLAGTVDLSAIESAIAAISGTAGFVITTPTGNITTALGYLPTLGTVTYG